jgi:hypothetical protein
MKNIDEFITENNAIPNIVKKINDIINYYGVEEIDTVIYDLLDGISNKGEDDMVVDNIKSWLDQLKK